VTSQTRLTIRGLFDFGTLKAVGSFVGIAGAGGGGFAALCFGIGYLATKSHDEMIGVPSTSLNSTTYVRTGALFFPNFIHTLVAQGIFYFLLAGVIAVLLGFFWALLARIKRSRGPAVVDFVRWQIPLFEILHLPMLALGIYVLLLQVAAFDPVNKDLLHRTAPGKGVLAAPAAEAGAVVLPRLLDVLGSGGTAVFSARIERHLRSERGEGWLLSLFGKESALLMVFLYGGLFLWRWRQSFKPGGEEPADAGPANLEAAPAGQVAVGTGDGNSFFFIDWVVHPILAAVAVALLLNLPATYGVCCMSRQGAWVRINDEARGAYLLSDLTAEPREIWTLGNETDKWKLRVYDRGDLKSILMTGRFTPNILALVSQESGPE
jgi:hypothetical protein